MDSKFQEIKKTEKEKIMKQRGKVSNHSFATNNKINQSLPATCNACIALFLIAKISAIST